MKTWHLHIEGQVQGVGFRPFVFALAQKTGLKGWVNNTIDGVHVCFNAEPTQAEVFKQKLLEQAPPHSLVTAARLQEIPKTFFDSFQIIHSQSKGKATLLLTPDLALCTDCKTELLAPEGRRKAYPFITCTHCGPRFSIIDQLPYDRENTRMAPFEMCPQCQKEYDLPSDRRYYSQTNSCPDCPIQLQLWQGTGKWIPGSASELLDRVVEEWKRGKIVAIKGIGGYLLTCDAANGQAVQELRARKHRPGKPFALMVPGCDDSIHAAERVELESAAAPIVLLPYPAIEAIAPGLDRVGVLLPYTPLYELLLQRFGRPIVATSGNISHSPIVFEDEKAKTMLGQLADFTLSNNRKIAVPQDDSVVQFSFFKKKRILLRRSRGLAPALIQPGLQLPAQTILAMGAELKSTFGWLHQGNLHVSQYLGDLSHFDTQQHYRLTLDHFRRVFQAQPEVLLCDQHPMYASTQLGQALAQEWQVPMHQYQHHQAHFAAILGEHQLLESTEPILGVVWDGTGLGADGQIWGGEFFRYQHYQVERCSHFAYFDFLLGDKMPREPRISALAVGWGITEATSLLQEKFTTSEWKIYHKLLEKKQPLQTSSVGRLFDAVAALLGLMDKQSYEGEAAMLLEVQALRYFKEHGLDAGCSYPLSVAARQAVDTKALIRAIVQDLRKGRATAEIAARFHLTLVDIIRQIANNLNIRRLAFSGGVFQNALLVDLIIHQLGRNFELYVHERLAPNDENISYGQLICFQIEQLFIKNKTEEYVLGNPRKN